MTPGSGEFAARPSSARAPFLHKIRLEILACDDEVETLVEVIAKHARTDRIGDGKIWVTPVGGAMRVRTGERDDAAL